MRALVILLFCFCLSGAAGAQEQAKGFLGAQLQDVTKQEADALGWESPHGAKLVKPVPGGPERRGSCPMTSCSRWTAWKSRTRPALSRRWAASGRTRKSSFACCAAAKKKRLAVTLGARPAEQARAAPKDVPILQLDTGGHMAQIRGLAFTPDGKFTRVGRRGQGHPGRGIRRAGKTVRTIRGRERGQGRCGQSPRHGAVAGWADGSRWGDVSRPRSN